MVALYIMEKTETKKVHACPECGSHKLIRDYSRAEVTCDECGLVISEDIIDTGPEWRAFDHEQGEKRGRVGAPMTYTIHDKGLSTMIDWKNKDIHGRDISAGRRAQIYRMRKWHKRIKVADAKDRNLAFALTELDRLSSHLHLPRNIREGAAMVYRKAVDKRLIRGRSIESVTSACIYIACREYKVPRTLDEIVEHSRVDKKEIGRSYRFITRELEIKLYPTSPVDYIPRFATELGLSGKVQRKAQDILEGAIKVGLTSGRGPTGVCAAAIYLAAIMEGERRTQKAVSEVAKVTEVTVRNRYKEIIEKLGIDVKI